MPLKIMQQKSRLYCVDGASFADPTSPRCFPFMIKAAAIPNIAYYNLHGNRSPLALNN